MSQNVYVTGNLTSRQRVERCWLPYSQVYIQYNYDRWRPQYGVETLTSGEFQMEAVSHYITENNVDFTSIGPEQVIELEY